MGEAIEVQTRSADAAGAVDELAPFAEEGALRLPSSPEVADGEWVRFEIVLADGTGFLEGLGRADGRVGGRVRLTMLQFDTRNEILFERILLAADPLNATGTIDLNAIGAVEELAAPRPPAPPSPSARAGRAPPPPRPAPLPRPTAAKAAPSAWPAPPARSAPSPRPPRSVPPKPSPRTAPPARTAPPPPSSPSRAAPRPSTAGGAAASRRPGPPRRPAPAAARAERPRPSTPAGPGAAPPNRSGRPPLTSPPRSARPPAAPVGRSPAQRPTRDAAASPAGRAASARSAPPRREDRREDAARRRDERRREEARAREARAAEEVARREAERALRAIEAARTPSDPSVDEAVDDALDAMERGPSKHSEATASRTPEAAAKSAASEGGASNLEEAIASAAKRAVTAPSDESGPVAEAAADDAEGTAAHALPEAASWQDRTAPSAPPRRRPSIRVPVSSPPAAPLETVISEAPAPTEITSLPLTPHQVAQAKALAAHLPRRVLSPRDGEAGEAAALRAALRIGLGALSALADHEDDFDA